MDKNQYVSTTSVGRSSISQKLKRAQKVGEGEGVMYDKCQKVSCPASCNRLLLINVFPDCVATISNTFQGENNFKSKNLQHSQNITFRFEYCQSGKLPQLVKVKLIQYNTIQYNTIQYNAIQHNTVQCSTIQYKTCIQYNAIQHNTVQCSTIQYKTCIQHNAMQYISKSDKITL